MATQNKQMIETEVRVLISRGFTQENNIGTGVGVGGVITLLGYAYGPGAVIHMESNLFGVKIRHSQGIYLLADHLFYVK